MDDRRFDSLVKLLASGKSRRSVLKGILGLGGAVAVGAARVDREVGAARRPAPTPKPTRCPGQQIPGLGGACGCPGNLHTCGPECCTDVAGGPPTPTHSECCDGACCQGTCYGEELCCATNPRPGEQPPANKVCDTSHGSACCPYSDDCCYIDGCCPTVCAGNGDYCCSQDNYCPGGGSSNDLCCTGSTPIKCDCGTNGNVCLADNDEACCTDSDCDTPPSDSSACVVGTCVAHVCHYTDCNAATQVCCPDDQGNYACRVGDECCTGDAQCTDTCEICRGWVCVDDLDTFPCGDACCNNGDTCCANSYCIPNGKQCCDVTSDCTVPCEICDTSLGYCISDCDSPEQCCTKGGDEECCVAAACHDDVGCCDDPAFCPGGATSDNLCCSGDKPICCGSGSDGNACIADSDATCCSNADCDTPPSGASECVSAVCNASHVCEYTDCPAGETCCGTGLGACTDLQIDPNNCGGCGHVCEGGCASCVGGVCTADQSACPPGLPDRICCGSGDTFDCQAGPFCGECDNDDECGPCEQCDRGTCKPFCADGDCCQQDAPAPDYCIPKGETCCTGNGQCTDACETCDTTLGYCTSICTVTGEACCALGGDEECCLPADCHDAVGCCDATSFCAGGDTSANLCCTGSTPVCCGGGTNINACIADSVDACCTIADCTNPPAGFSACGIVACNAGHDCEYTDCPTVATCCGTGADACTDLHTDPNNCGSCGHGCQGDCAICVAGACAAAADSVCGAGKICCGSGDTFDCKTGSSCDGCDGDEECGPCEHCTQGTCEAFCTDGACCQQDAPAEDYCVPLGATCCTDDTACDDCQTCIDGACVDNCTGGASCCTESGSGQCCVAASEICLGGVGCCDNTEICLGSGTANLCCTDPTPVKCACGTDGNICLPAASGVCCDASNCDPVDNCTPAACVDHICNTASSCTGGDFCCSSGGTSSCKTGSDCDCDTDDDCTGLTNLSECAVGYCKILRDSATCDTKAAPSGTICHPTGTNPICAPAATCNGLYTFCPEPFYTEGHFCGECAVCDHDHACIDRCHSGEFCCPDTDGCAPLGSTCCTGNDQCTGPCETCNGVYCSACDSSGQCCTEGNSEECCLASECLAGIGCCASADICGAECCGADEACCTASSGSYCVPIGQCCRDSDCTETGDCLTGACGTDGLCTYTPDDTVCGDTSLCYTGAGACNATTGQCEYPQIVCDTPPSTPEGTVNCYEPIGTCDPANGECNYAVDQAQIGKFCAYCRSCGQSGLCNVFSASPECSGGGGVDF